MAKFRKSAVEPIVVELLDGRSVSLRASVWTFKQHYSGLRAADVADLDKFDAMMEFLWDCVLDRGEMTKDEFFAAMPLDPDWIAKLFAVVVGAASPDHPTLAVEPPSPPTPIG